VDLDVDYATTLVAAVLLGIGFVLQQYSAEQEPESRFLSLRILTDLLGKPRWLLGIACMVAGYLRSKPTCRRRGVPARIAAPPSCWRPTRRTLTR